MTSLAFRRADRRPRWVGALALAVAAALPAAVVRAPLLSVAALGAAVGAAFLLLRLEAAVLVFVGLAPFEDYANSVSGASVKLAGLLLFAAWGLRLLADTSRRRLRHPGVRAAIVLLFVVLASALMHTNPPAGTAVVVRYASFIGAFVVLADVLRGPLSPRRVAEVYVLSCAAAAVCGLFESLVQGDYRAAGPLGDANDFAFFLVAAFPLALALRTYGRRRLWIACAVLSLAGIAGSLSRGAALGLVVVAVWAVSVGHIKVRTAALSAAFVATSLVLVALLVPALVSEKLEAKNKVADTNVDERKIRWLVTAEMASDHPVLGIGPGGFQTQYERYVGDRDTNPTHQLKVAHQMYLEVAAELGFVGLAAFLFVGIAGWRGARSVALGRGARAAAGPAFLDVHPPVSSVVIYKVRPPDGPGGGPGSGPGSGLATVTGGDRGGPDRALAVGVQAALLGMAVAAMFLTEQYYLPVWLLPAMGIALELRRARA